MAIVFDAQGNLIDTTGRIDFSGEKFESALTQDTPTPCKPPDTLYVSLSNLPPACSTVITTSKADFFSLG